MIDWIKSGAALAVALSAFWGAWSKLWVARIRPHLRRRRAHNEIVKNSIVFNKMMVQLQTFRARAAAMRTLCIVAKNCGSDWDPQKSVTITVIGEAHEDHVPRVFERWQERPADCKYRQMLSDVIHAKDIGVLLVTEKLPDSELRDYYLDQGVCASIVFSVAVTEDSELIYISLNFGQPRDDGEHLPEDVVSDHVESARRLHRNSEFVRRMTLESRHIWKG